MIRKNNLGQITIFIIIALILVVVILMLFLLMRKPDLQVQDSENPQAYIDGCTRQVTEEAVNLLSEQGGDITPEGSTMFRGRNITYLCYNANFYQQCIMQRPDLVNHIENQITNYIQPKIENCFQALNAKLEAKNYDIEMGGMNLKTTLQTGRITIDVNRNFKMTKREETRSFNNFKSTISSPLYELAGVAMEISNKEAEYCSFDILNYMALYPQYNLDKFRPWPGDTVYRIRDIQTNKEFIFAIRSCALPAGY